MYPGRTNPGFVPLFPRNSLGLKERPWSPTKERQESVIPPYIRMGTDWMDWPPHRKDPNNWVPAGERTRPGPSGREQALKPACEKEDWDLELEKAADMSTRAPDYPFQDVIEEQEALLAGDRERKKERGKTS